MFLSNNHQVTYWKANSKKTALKLDSGENKGQNAFHLTAVGKTGCEVEKKNVWPSYTNLTAMSLIRNGRSENSIHIISLRKLFGSIKCVVINTFIAYLIAPIELSKQRKQNVSLKQYSRYVEIIYQ